MPRCISDIQHFRDPGNRDALGNGADSPRGTLTLPAKLRTKYRLDEGDSLTLVDLDAGILLSPKVQVVPKLAAEIERIRRSLGL